METILEKRYPMGSYDHTEVIMGSDENSCSITDDFDHCEREKSLECALNGNDVSNLQTITDCHGRTYLVTDVMVSERETLRRIRVTPIDLDGHDF